MIRHFRDPPTAAAAILLALAVAWSPLPFGSILPRDRLVLELVAALVLVLAVLGRQTVPRGAATAALALAGVAAVGLLQSLPWPEAVASEAAVAAWRTARGLLGEETGGFVPLSLAPAVSRATALVWLAVAAVLAASAALGGERPARRSVALTLAAVTVFEIVYGADSYFEQQPAIWGRTLAAGGDRLRGTFVNPDHFATFLIVPLTASFAWGWWSVRRVSARAALERWLLQAILPWLLFLLTFVGLAFTGSRAGLTAALLALAVQAAVLLAVEKRRWRVFVLGGGALLVGTVGLFYFGLRQGLGRFLTTSAYEVTWNVRLEVWAKSLELWRLFPWTGTGLGTFREAFPKVQPPDMPLAWYHAHSDVLELLVTTGIVGPALLAAGLVALVRRLWTGLRQGRRSEDRAAALAALGALAGALAHSTVDFGLTLPANAFVLAAVLGLGCGVKTVTPAPSPLGGEGGPTPGGRPARSARRSRSPATRGGGT